MRESKLLSSEFLPLEEVIELNLFEDFSMSGNYSHLVLTNGLKGSFTHLSRPFVIPVSRTGTTTLLSKPKVFALKKCNSCFF
jgi:hypothetical protein